MRSPTRAKEALRILQTTGLDSSIVSQHAPRRERLIANYTHAIAKANFPSLDQTLGAAEQRRATLQAELAQLNGNNQPAVVQRTPAALQRHLEGMTENGNPAAG